jgi:cytidine deaminase|tara:strand:+ start:2528 stop:2914 length:387 start_codon:yes stop_codon:yes gene_type:complete
MTDQDLISKAMESRDFCYCPYSKFPVSAALLSKSGRVFTGVNVENASYGLTICAERVAIGTAVASGEREFMAIAIVVKNGGSPCGACRQILNEFSPRLRILMADENGKLVRETTLDMLLPEAFGPHSL